MLFEQTLPRILSSCQFTWNPLVGAYDCVDAAGHRFETSLTACTCAVSIFCGSPCAHSMELLAQAEDGAIHEGPASVAGELDRQRAVQEALIEEIQSRAWDFALEDPEPGEACFFCSRPTPSLFTGWVAVCAVCLSTDLEDE